MTRVTLRGGRRVHIPGRMVFDEHRAMLVPTEDCSGISSEIDFEDLLVVTGQLVRAAHRRRWDLRHVRLNTMRLEIARACIDKALREFDPIV